MSATPSTPSLTPHEDALRRNLDARPEPQNEFELLVYRAADAGLMGIARLMDAGQGHRAACGLVISVCATLIDTLAQSYASGTADPAATIAEQHQLLLGNIAFSLNRGAAHTQQSAVEKSEAGRA